MFTSLKYPWEGSWDDCGLHLHEACLLFVTKKVDDSDVERALVFDFDVLEKTDH